MSWHVNRIAAGSKRTRFIHDPQTIVHNSCPACGKSKSEMKEMLERGGKQMSPNKQLERLKQAGLPTKLDLSQLTDLYATRAAACRHRVSCRVNTALTALA